MTQKYTFYAVAGSIAAFLILLTYSYFVVTNGAGELLAKQALMLTALAFLVFLGYEDWKDAKRAGHDKSD